MRAVFVNHCHPDTPHVCATRAREFARALAARGHRIVLLTETLRRDDPGDAAAGLPRRLAAHDWSAPLAIAAAPSGHAILQAQRSGALPALLRKPVVVAYYAMTGSVFADWGRGAAALADALAAGFRPEAVWASFGNTECLRTARRIAARANAPWVLDVKDYWSTFIPGPLRRTLARRFGDAAAVTALSAGHLADIGDWMALPARQTVIHSGIPASFVTATAAGAPECDMLITGAIYDTDALATLLAGVGRWAVSRGGPSARIAYAGDQGALVAGRARALGGIVSVVDHGYVALDRLQALQRAARVNAFTRSGPGWFQHKLPELIAARRPILCLPPAEAESTSLAAAAGVPMHNCATADDVAAAMAAADTGAPPAPDPEIVRGFTWQARAAELEAALAEAVGGRPS